MPSWMKWTIALLIGFAIIVIGFRWFGWLLTSFFVMNCLVLMIVVLLQSGKAADLAGAFGGAGSQTAFGPSRRRVGSFSGHNLVRRYVHGLRFRHGVAHGQSG